MLAWDLTHDREPLDVLLSPAPAPAAAVPVGTRAAPIKLVVPAFDNRTGDADFDALTTVTRDLLNDSSETIIGMLGRTTTAARASLPAGPIDDATWIRAAASVRAPALVLGAVTRQPTGYRISVRVVEPRTGARWLDRAIDVADRDAALGAAAELALAIRARLGDTAPADQRTRAGDAFRLTTLAAAAAYARASDQTQSGGWDAAVAEASRAVAADPQFAMGQVALGLAYGNAGRNEDAERAYRAALAHLDRLPESTRLLASGLYFMVRHEPAKAIEQLAQYVERYPANFGGRLDLANAHFAARDMAAAERVGREAYDMSHLPIALANVALYAAYAGDFDDAVRAATEVIAGGGDITETALLALAHAELGLDRVAEAHAAYAQLAKVGATSSSRATAGEADLALAEGRLDDAARLLADGIAADTRANALELARGKQALLAETHARMSRHADALADADRVADASHELGALVAVARVYAAEHAADRAAAIAAQLRLHTDAEAQSYAALIDGEIALAAGHPRDALARFEAAQARADTWLARLDSARAYLALELYPEAYQALEACTKRRGEALALFLDDTPTYRYWRLAVDAQRRAEAGLRQHAEQ